MSLPGDLLAQAKHLAEWDSRRPRQANLRRSISTAYYAMFHLVTSGCVQGFAPPVPNTLGMRMARAVAHSEVKDVCAMIWKGQLSYAMQELLPTGASASLQGFSESFVELQEARHRADYDLSATYSRAEVLQLLNQVDQAFIEWELIQPDELNVFLSAVLFAKRWNR